MWRVRRLLRIVCALSAVSGRSLKYLWFLLLIGVVAIAANRSVIVILLNIVLSFLTGRDVSVLIFTHSTRRLYLYYVEPL